MSAVRTLLESLIDYAGLFPPAGLDMAAAVRNYAAYRSGPHRWALGKFILPVSRLEEFKSAAASHLDPGDPWPLSVLGGPDLAADLRAISAFRRLDAQIVSLEIKAASPVEVERAALSIRGVIETFYEIPISQSPEEILNAIHEAHGRAKIRTGGTKPGMVPSTEELTRFLTLCPPCAAFKATAGLHHALRGVRPLTYEAGCESDRMHGFLNVFLAATLALLEIPAGQIRSLIEDEDRRNFEFGESAIRWRDEQMASVELELARSNFSLSFGSCSFEEPIAELKELGLL
jgi:hypothetical protein